MTADTKTIDFASLQETFPWREEVIASRTGGIVRVIDRHGNEVPLFTMTAFLVSITAKLAKKEAQS